MNSNITYLERVLGARNETSSKPWKRRWMYWSSMAAVLAAAGGLIGVCAVTDNWIWGAAGLGLFLVGATKLVMYLPNEVFPADLNRVQWMLQRHENAIHHLRSNGRGDLVQAIQTAYAENINNEAWWNDLGHALYRIEQEQSVSNLFVGDTQDIVTVEDIPAQARQEAVEHQKAVTLREDNR